MSTNQYQEMRNRQQAEVNAFPMFFAFNKQQFAEGMRKLGLSPSDTRQVCSIFGGGYCRKSDVAKLNEMFTLHRKELEDAIAGDKTGQGFICDMFLQELENHEYSYTGDVQETLDALGITPSIWRLFRNCWMAWLWPVKRLCSTVVSTDPERNHALSGPESTAAAAHMPPAGFSLTGGAIFEFSRNDMRPPLF